MECCFMARLARAEVFDPSEITVVHVMASTVRRCYLLGADPVSKRNFDHRKLWIECKLQQIAAQMGIDLLAFALDVQPHASHSSRPA